MCLAIPMELKEISGDIGVVELGGVRKEVRLTLVDSPALGDYLIVHAGFAIQKLDRAQAEADLALLAEIEQKEASLSARPAAAPRPPSKDGRSPEGTPS